MGILESSSRSKTLPLICPIRNKQVSILPEEQVRVHLLFYLLSSLGFPKSCIAIEKELSQMPHLKGVAHSLPKRRADIICYAKDVHPIEPFYPLLLIECKAVKLTNRMRNQVVGYNHFLKAHYIALVNAEEVQMGWFDAATAEYQWINRLVSYNDLVSAVKIK